ncbi:hypothetical protein J6590_050905 [Homalodisca vitripennis]|nr:hypothetical protein J6590_050905 [Homalodisca vitripennis]
MNRLVPIGELDSDDDQLSVQEENTDSEQSGEEGEVPELDMKCPEYTGKDSVTKWKVHCPRLNVRTPVAKLDRRLPRCANITKDDYLKQQTQWVCFSCIDRNVCDSPNQSNELSPLGLSDNVDKIMTGAKSHATMKQSRTVDKIVEFQATMKHSGTADKISVFPPLALGARSGTG